MELPSGSSALPATVILLIILSDLGDPDDTVDEQSSFSTVEWARVRVADAIAEARSVPDGGLRRSLSTCDKLARNGFSLENSGCAGLCHKAMEWLSDDTTHVHYSV